MWWWIFVLSNLGLDLIGFNWISLEIAESKIVERVEESRITERERDKFANFVITEEINYDPGFSTGFYRL